LLNEGIAAIKPFFCGDVRLFGLSDLPAAKDWIASAKKGGCMMVVLTIAARAAQVCRILT
jgi:hypothetical protein